MKSPTVAELRRQAKAQYNRGKGNPKLKGYGKMRKPQLMAALGITAQSSPAKYRASKSSRFSHQELAWRVSKLAGKTESVLGGREEVLKTIKSAVAKTRRQIKAKTGKEATQQELRASAIAAIREVAKKRAASKPKAPSGISEMSVHDLNFDPKRFQYKLVHGETGSSGSLSGVRKWDANLAGIIQVWRDPKDGKDYVVNGHNRASLAKKLGADKVVVRHLDVKDSSEARAVGALTNIAEGRGNSLDAAKFFRDSGISRKELEDRGIPMREKIASDGLALSKLSDPLFQKVVQGEIPQERAVIIGDRVSDHTAQSKLVELIDKETKKGRKITNDVVSELAQMVQSAPKHEEQQMTLFGLEDNSRNLALEKAELLADVRRRLSREKRLFGLVSKTKAAKDLQKGGNKIDVEQSGKISQQADFVLNVFDKLKNQSGVVSETVNSAAKRIANGEDSKKVRDELHKQLLQEIPKALGFRERQSA